MTVQELRGSARGRAARSLDSAIQRLLCRLPRHGGSASAGLLADGNDSEAPASGRLRWVPSGLVEVVSVRDCVVDHAEAQLPCLMGRTVHAQAPRVATRWQPKAAHVESDRKVDGDSRLDAGWPPDFCSGLRPHVATLGVPHNVTVLGPQLQFQMNRGIGLFPRNQQEKRDRRARREAGAEESADATPIDEQLAVGDLSVVTQHQMCDHAVRASVQASAGPPRSFVICHTTGRVCRSGVSSM